MRHVQTSSGVCVLALVATCPLFLCCVIFWLGFISLAFCISWKWKLLSSFLMHIRLGLDCDVFVSALFDGLCTLFWSTDSCTAGVPTNARYHPGPSSTWKSCSKLQVPLLEFMRTCNLSSNSSLLFWLYITCRGNIDLNRLHKFIASCDKCTDYSPSDLIWGWFGTFWAKRVYWLQKEFLVFWQEVFWTFWKS